MLVNWEVPVPSRPPYAPPASLRVVPQGTTPHEGREGAAKHLETGTNPGESNLVPPPPPQTRWRVPLPIRRRTGGKDVTKGLTLI